MSIILVRFNENGTSVYRAFSSNQNRTSHAFISDLFHHLNMYNENPFHTNTPYGIFLGMHVAECDVPINQRGDIVYFTAMRHHVFSPVFFTRNNLNNYTNNYIANQTEPYCSMYRNMSTTYTIGHTRI